MSIRPSLPRPAYRSDSRPPADTSPRSSRPYACGCSPRPRPCTFSEGSHARISDDARTARSSETFPVRRAFSASTPSPRSALVSNTSEPASEYACRKAARSRELVGHIAFALIEHERRRYAIRLGRHLTKAVHELVGAAVGAATRPGKRVARSSVMICASGAANDVVAARP